MQIIDIETLNLSFPETNLIKTNDTGRSNNASLIYLTLINPAFYLPLDLSVQMHTLHLK